MGEKVWHGSVMGLRGGSILQGRLCRMRWRRGVWSGRRFAAGVGQGERFRGTTGTTINRLRLSGYVSAVMGRCTVPDCNIRNMDVSLLRAMKMAAAGDGLTLRDWAIVQFSRGVKWAVPADQPMDPAVRKHAINCSCGMCRPGEVG